MPTAEDHPTSTQLTGDLKTVLGRAHETSLALLNDKGASRLDVVAWLSAHVAAFEQSIYPIARRRLPDGAALLAEDREVVARLVHTLRVAERMHTGDVLASNLSGQRLTDRLLELVNEHSRVQQRLVARLADALDPAEADSLAKEYGEALAHAPTRPHPHLHNRMLFRLDALRDRLLDTMDGRHVPVPRVARTYIAPGRWGSYLLGQPHPDAELGQPRPPR
ncbi:MAG TPA: hypothetical protein VG899_11915 [Mycobacteriales bacterium]|nr:hypothetical protein [Mycobacteriales bacterium]